jgi:hypothetical protein
MSLKKYDQHCTVCEWSAEILAIPGEHPPCPMCGEASERWWPIGATSHSIISDEIIGGQFIENIDRHPVFVESKSQYRRELAARNLVEKVRHVGLQGSDKNPRTQRWV